MLTFRKKDRKKKSFDAFSADEAKRDEHHIQVTFVAVLFFELKFHFLFC